MTKNITRKSLALGAGLALVASGLVAAPAQAAAAITIAPNAGTTYDVLSTDDFTLKVFGNVDFTFASGTDLQWEVTKAAGQTVQADDTTSISSAMTAGTDSTSTVEWYDAASVSAVAGANTFTIDPTGNTTYRTSSVKVRAYIELDGSNGFTSGDLGSNQVTVRFLGSADIAAAVSVDAFKIGDTAQTVRATIAGLNYHQANAGNALKTVVYDNGVAQSAANVTANTAKTAFTASYSNTAATGDVIGAKLTALDYEGGAQKDVAAATYKAVNESLVTQITDFEATLSSTVRAAVSADFSEVATDDVKYAVKKGTTSFTISGVFKDADGEPQAGAPITVTVAEDTSGADSVGNGAVISAGGETFTASATDDQSLSYVGTTDANGKLTVTVTNSLAADNDRLSIVMASSSTVKKTAVVGWESNGIKDIVVTSNPGSGVTQRAKASTVSATIKVRDDFGADWVDATSAYRIATSLSGTSSQAVTEVTYSGSPVTVAWTDASATTGALTATFTLQKQGVSSWATATNRAASNIGTKTAVYEIVAAGTTAATLTAGTFLADNSTAYTYGTTATQALEVDDYSDETITNGNHIKGKALTSTGAAAAGVTVTISAPGVGFFNGTSHTVGSASVNTTATGDYEFEVYSNQAGVQTFTVTSGTATKTAKIEYTAAAAGTGTSVVIDAPSSVLAGSTLIIKATITDKWGNPVATTDNSGATTPDSYISYVGPGLLVGTTPVNATKGVMSLGYLIGSTDTGSIVVTAGYDKNGDEDYVDFGDIVVTKTITIGAPPVAAVAKKVNAGSFKGYVAVYARGYEGQRLSAKIGKDWVVGPSIVNNQENGPLFRVTDFTGAGVDIAVRIYIDRVLIDTINLTTK